MPTPKSDIDLCLDDHPGQPLDLQAPGRIAADFDDRHPEGLLTPIGGWGPWRNGGGWLIVHVQPVDILYRKLSHAACGIEACHAGQVKIVHPPGHPHGFISSM